MSDTEGEGLSKRLVKMFTGDDDDSRRSDGRIDWYLSQEGVAHAIIELHDRQELSFGDIAQCFPFSRAQIGELYEEHLEDYPNVE